LTEWLDRILAEYAANFCENKTAPAWKLWINVVLGADDLLGLSFGYAPLGSACWWRQRWYRHDYWRGRWDRGMPRGCKYRFGRQLFLPLGFELLNQALGVLD
jgi:hypothetical protein